ncbi:hypothetical protein [Amnibacterium endophyticum]|uniref:Uncharacterized protein n=1 Tax=Amnibacterium endophyticum TaxID=2109337 RepID=A0ABW4LI94_9MICO
MVLEVLARTLPLVGADGTAVEMLLAGAVVVVLLSAAVLLHVVRVPVAAQVAAPADGFARLRVLLRATDPAAPGHVRTRAPAPTR